MVVSRHHARPRHGQRVHRRSGDEPVAAEIGGEAAHRREVAEERIRYQRGLVGDQAIPRGSAISHLKLAYDVVQVNLNACFPNNRVRQLPIIVETTAVLEVLYHVRLDNLTGKVLGGLRNSRTVRSRHVDEHSVHVEKHARN